MTDRFNNKSRPLRWWPAALAALAASVCLGANVGDVLYVNRAAVPLRSGAFSFDKAVAKMNVGDSVAVTAVDGKWLKVRYAPKSASTQPASVEGYVYESALSAQPISVPSGEKGASVSSNESTGALSAAAYSDARGLSPDALSRIIAESRAAMKNADARFDRFTRAGRIGPHKPVPATQPH